MAAATVLAGAVAGAAGVVTARTYQRYKGGNVSTVVDSAARVTSGNSSAVEVGAAGVHAPGRVCLLVDVTSYGTGTGVTFSVEWSHDGATWFTADTADSMTAFTAAAKHVKSFSVKAPYYRVVWTYNSLNTATFSVTEFVTNL